MNYKPVLLSLLIATLSCSKPIDLEKPILVKSVTFQRHHLGTNGMTYKIDTSIHWCRVAGEDLVRFENLSKKPYYVCGTVPEIWGRLTITQACATLCSHKTNIK